MANKCWFVYYSWLEAIESLSDSEAGRLLKCCLRYSSTGEGEILSGNERAIWLMIKPQIDRDNERAEEISQKRREAGALSRSNCNQLQPNDSNCNHKRKIREEENKRREEERKTEPKAQAPKGDVFAEFAGEDQALLSALREFSAFRKALKKPLTEPAERRLTKRLLDQFPREEWIPILNQSVDKGWQDVYPLQDPRQNPSRKEKVTNNIFAEIAMEEGIF